MVMNLITIIWFIGSPTIVVFGIWLIRKCKDEMLDSINYGERLSAYTVVFTFISIACIAAGVMGIFAILEQLVIQ